MRCQHFNQMIKSVSIQGHCIDVPSFFYTHSLYDEWWGENLSLGRFVVGGSTFVFIIFQVFTKLSQLKISPYQLFLATLLFLGTLISDVT